LKVTEHHTKKDWASFMQGVLEEQYPNAEKVILVMDNLNTHTPASFYEILPPEQAKAFDAVLLVYLRKVLVHWQQHACPLQRAWGTDTLLSFSPRLQNVLNCATIRAKKRSSD
jgi:hypothetical protein